MQTVETDRLTDGLTTDRYITLSVTRGQRNNKLSFAFSRKLIAFFTFFLLIIVFFFLCFNPSRSSINTVVLFSRRCLSVDRNAVSCILISIRPLIVIL